MTLRGVGEILQTCDPPARLRSGTGVIARWGKDDHVTNTFGVAG
jgi:hypothetical protein